MVLQYRDSRPRLARASLCLLLVMGLPPAGAEAQTAVEARQGIAEGWAEYVLDHPLKVVTGRSRTVEGRVEHRGEEATFTVRAPVASFDSGNRNRDAHMLEAVDARRHPYATISGSLGGVRLDGSTPLRLRCSARVLLHGVTRETPVELTIHQRDDGSLRVRFALVTALSDHQIEKPRLLFMSVADELPINGELSVTWPAALPARAGR